MRNWIHFSIFNCFIVLNESQLFFCISFSYQTIIFYSDFIARAFSIHRHSFLPLPIEIDRVNRDRIDGKKSETKWRQKLQTKKKIKSLELKFTNVLISCATFTAIFRVIERWVQKKLPTYAPYRTFTFFFEPFLLFTSESKEILIFPFAELWLANAAR